MSDHYYHRTQQVLRERFGRLLAAWLATLPREGWSGSVDALGDQLDGVNEARKFYAFVPLKSGLSKTLAAHESVIVEAGWRLSFRRTAKARFIEFTRTTKG